MLKQAAFICLLTVLAGCQGGGPAGKLPGSTPRSHVTPLFAPVSLNQSHGDGKFATFTIKMPLSETSIDAVNSPIDPRGGISRVPILGDVLRLVGQATLNVVTRFGVADQQLIISQPIPEIDTDIVKHVSIKRVFFQIKETERGQEQRRRRRSLPTRVFRGVRDLIRGDADIDFDFIDELKIDMRMHTAATEVTSWIPEVIFSDDTTGRYVLERQIADANRAPVFNLLDYRKKNRQKLTHRLAPVFTFYTEKPVELQRIFRRIEAFREVVADMTKVGKSVIVELRAAPGVRAAFLGLLKTHERDLAEVPFNRAECNEDLCMDMKVNGDNLLPLLMTGDTLKIDTAMELDKVPPTSFQLRGYLEFEIKIDSPL